MYTCIFLQRKTKQEHAPKIDISKVVYNMNNFKTCSVKDGSKADTYNVKKNWLD